MIVCCPRCGGPLRRTGPGGAASRCDRCGPVPPLHVPEHVSPLAMDLVAGRVARDRDDADEDRFPLWCPWPMPAGWLVSGVAWAGDEAGGVVATALACSGPSPLRDEQADLLLVAEDPGVGLGSRFAGLLGADPGGRFAALAGRAAHARVRADGRDTPMWTVGDRGDRVAHVGEARGRWLYAVAWPADAGYLLSEPVSLLDLADERPGELVFGPPSTYLQGGA
jgi:hypothetical protein